MTLGYLTEAAANSLLEGGTMPATYYAQQHTGPPGLAFDENVGPDTRRIPVTFTTAAAGSAANTSDASLIGAPADAELTYLTLWDANPAGACWWVVPCASAPVSVAAGDTLRIAPAAITLTLDIWTQ